jgi:putative transposase
MAQLALSLPIPMPVAAPQRVLLPDPEAQQQAEQRLAVVNQVLDYQKDPQRFGRLQMKDGTRVTSVSRMVAYVAETSGNCEKTIWRWLELYKRGGVPALADRVRSDKGQSRFFKEHSKAALLVAYLFLDCRASAAVCHESIVREAAVLEIPAEDLPSVATVRRWLNAMPASLTVYAREGKKIYRERMSPYLTRGFTDVFANSVLIADHAILDVEVQNDSFDNVEWGAPIRIRLSAMMDYRSRLITGVTFCWEGSSRAIAACLRRSISKYGPPEHLYVDNGKDYRKVARGAVRGCETDAALAPESWKQAELDQIAATGFLARLNIAVTHCIPHHPQSKAIERFFGTLHERFDKVWPTYTSGSPFTRPESTEAAMMKHRRLLKAGRVGESKHPKASQFILACLGWLEEYADTVHTGEGFEGATPRQAFEANLNPAQKPAPDYATLALLMAEHSVRQVSECAVTLNKHRYTPTDQQGWADMHFLNERQVIVAHDAADLDNVAALDMDGNFVAWLEREELVRFAPYDPKTQARIADSMATRRRLEKGNRECIELVARAARANGAVSPLEAMANRLQLSAGETGKDVVTQRNRKPGQGHITLTAPPTPAQAARMFLQTKKDA